MDFETLRTRARWLFFREGFLYVLVFSVALMCVDVPGVVQSVKIRKLNDLATGIDMTQLSLFSRGRIPASAVNWKGLITYFSTIMDFFPSQEDAEMFLGYCEYYGLGHKDEAFDHIRRSADTIPYYFWNAYNTGLLSFQKGDYDHAIPYLEMVLLLPADKIIYAMGNSIIYRQFFAEAFGPDLMVRMNRARERAVLLMAAACFYKGNFDMAELFAMKGLTTPGITDPGPFYFYAGAIAMARGNSKKALSFFDQAMKANSRNPMVDHYIKEMSQRGWSLEQENWDQFPYPGYLQLEFY